MNKKVSGLFGAVVPFVVGLCLLVFGTFDVQADTGKPEYKGKIVSLASKDDTACKVKRAEAVFIMDNPGNTFSTESARIAYGTASYSGSCMGKQVHVNLKATDGGKSGGKITVVYEGDGSFGNAEYPMQLILIGDAANEPFTAEAILSFGGSIYLAGEFTGQK